MLGQTDRACPDKLTQLQLLTGNCPVTGHYLEHCGGPFTVEQVEDVKTLFRMLALTAPLCLCFLSFQMQSSIIYNYT